MRFPGAAEDGADPQHHRGAPVEQLETPVVYRDLVRLHQGRDGLGEGEDESHPSFWPVAGNAFKCLQAINLRDKA